MAMKSNKDCYKIETKTKQRKVLEKTRSYYYDNLEKYIDNASKINYQQYWNCWRVIFTFSLKSYLCGTHMEQCLGSTLRTQRSHDDRIWHSQQRMAEGLASTRHTIITCPAASPWHGKEMAGSDQMVGIIAWPVLMGWCSPLWWCCCCLLLMALSFSGVTGS